MYTIQMILDQLSASSVIIRSIVSSDQVSAIRIYKNDTMKDNILYLSQANEADSTLCQTAGGSSLIL